MKIANPNTVISNIMKTFNIAKSRIVKFPKEQEQQQIAVLNNIRYSRHFAKVILSIFLLLL